MSDRMGAHASTLAALNARLDPALDDRVRLHTERRAGRITVAEYLAGLKAVRDLEDELEPQRRALGASSTRAFELSIEAAA
jgi:hypothetical protein